MAKKKGFKLVSLRRKKRGRPKKKTGIWKLVLVLILIIVTIPSIVAYMWFKKNILDKLPDVSKIEKVVFSQTTTITDRNGIVLYKVFSENRQYVKLDKISKNIQNALISIEDKNFWKNPGIDVQGIIRAGIHDVFFGKKQGASTLTQQIIKNLILTREKTITRKLKEIVLAFKLNQYLSEKAKKQYKNLSDEEVKRKVKEQILEMYLNYVFFGNNAYGVQAASQTYFHKDANTLTVLESAVLAGIPKSPVNYNPIINRDNNLGKLEIYNLSGDSIPLTGNFKKTVENVYISSLEDKTFSLAKEESDILDIIAPDAKLKYGKLYIKYIPGRKDYILIRMYLDGYIDKKQFLQAMKEGFDKKIYSPKVEIKAPHFVFYVLKELEKKYGKDVISKAGWTIKTSLDYKIQKVAEATVKQWSSYLAKKGANNTALLYVNSKNGDILAYVGSKDYYNKDVDGQVDIITSKRQCGSVIKPLIYTNAFIQNKTFTPDTPIFDTKFDIADRGHTFNNFDGKFRGLMPIRKALPYSRNIPAAKMYYLGGGEYKVKKFLKKVGLTTLSNRVHYGYPLAIGAAEIKMLDFAQAYSHLSNIDGAVKINPILSIKGADGSIVYKKTPEKLKQYVPSSVVSIMWYILSNPANRPPTWNKVMQIKGLKIATKSGTTNIIDKKTGKKYPRDGWFIGYTPSKVLMVWAGNTKGEHMHSDAFGGWTAGKVWDDFVVRLKNLGYIKYEDMQLRGTTSVSINMLNGKKSSIKTPIQLVRQTIARIDGVPAPDDGRTVRAIKVDSMCNGVVSEYTPEQAVKTAYIVNIHSYRPSDRRWENGVRLWWNSVGKSIYSKVLGGPILDKEPTEICKDRLIIAQKGKMDFDIIYPLPMAQKSYVFNLGIRVNNSPFPISKVEFYVDSKKIQTEAYRGNNFVVYIPSTFSEGVHNITVRLIDSKGYINDKTLSVVLHKKDTDKPYLYKIQKIYEGSYKYIFKDKSSRVLGGFLICDGVKTRFRGNTAIGNSKNCGYSMVIDYYGNTLSK